MWEINNIVSQLRIVPKPPPPEPPPLPKIDLQTETNSKKDELNQLNLQWKNKIERLAANVAPALDQAVGVFKPDFNANNPSPERVRQIAVQNAPLLVLPQSNSGFEQFFENLGLPNVSQGNLPADPNAYIANSRLREDVPIGVDVKFGFPPVSISGKDEAIGDNTNGETGDDFSAATVGNVTNENYFLDLNNDMRDKLGSKDAPVSYEFQPAQYDANGKPIEPPKLTYHLFYAYNDAPKAGGIDFNHEGDWERVTYELDPQTFEPLNAVLSAHEGGSTIAFGDLQTDAASNRPLIFVANGSHANYAAPGNHPIEIAGIPVTYDQTSDVSDAVIFDTARNLNDVTAQSWYPSAGSRGLHWGEIGETSHSSGPQGPSQYKGAVEP